MAANTGVLQLLNVVGWSYANVKQYINEYSHGAVNESVNGVGFTDGIQLIFKGMLAAGKEPEHVIGAHVCVKFEEPQTIESIVNELHAGDRLVHNARPQCSVYDATTVIELARLRENIKLETERRSHTVALANLSAAQATVVQDYEAKIEQQRTAMAQPRGAEVETAIADTALPIVNVHQSIAKPRQSIATARQSIKVTAPPTARREPHLCTVPMCKSKGFAMKQSLTKHMKDHAALGVDNTHLKCGSEGCKSTSTTVRGMFRHMNECHNVEQNSYKCQQIGCPKMFKQRRTVIEHHAKWHPQMFEQLSCHGQCKTTKRFATIEEKEKHKCVTRIR